ncbi:hypothetical protein LWI29_013148 [Acer saccharum]|uniref:NAB domain-containing protein n=1 Tax=Acer saccharum TaxID=4024 RepID=A0AA39SAV1_ACESA|nr:hypothetical protein LWI29_013148 [Acer saccharum]
MENNASSCSWSPDTRDSPHQSLWLQTTLSELDRKMKTMMTLLGEDDNSSVQGIEFDNRKPELVKMLEDFNKSYRSLAEQHDQLRSKSHSGSWSSSSSSNSRKKIQQSSYNQRRVARSFNVPKLEAFDSNSDSVVEDPDVECSTAHADFKYLNKIADELMSNEPCKMNFKTTEIRDHEMYKETTEIPNHEEMKINGFVTGSSGWENAWPELKFQVTKLLEENLRQLAQLLKRNDEKRKIINELRAQLEHSKSEKRACLSSSEADIKRNQFQRSRSHGLSFSKFFKVGCS